MWIAVYVAVRRSEAQRVKEVLTREGFLTQLREDSSFEVLVPESEAAEAQEVICGA